MLWLKALHLIAMVVWFAALFYLPRLFVYHAQSDDAVSKERFKLMERRLFFGIMTPGAVLTLAFGFALLAVKGWSAYAETLWMPLKLALIAALVAYHIHCGRLLYVFRDDCNRHGHVYYRWLNEFPTLILVSVIILAVVKPF